MELTPGIGQNKRRDAKAGLFNFSFKKKKSFKSDSSPSPQTSPRKRRQRMTARYTDIYDERFSVDASDPPISPSRQVQVKRSIPKTKKLSSPNRPTARKENTNNSKNWSRRRRFIDENVTSSDSENENEIETNINSNITANAYDNDSRPERENVSPSRSSSSPSPQVSARKRLQRKTKIYKKLYEETFSVDEPHPPTSSQAPVERSVSKAKRSRGNTRPTVTVHKENANRKNGQGLGNQRSRFVDPSSADSENEMENETNVNSKITAAVVDSDDNGSRSEGENLTPSDHDSSPPRYVSSPKKRHQRTAKRSTELSVDEEMLSLRSPKNIVQECRSPKILRSQPLDETCSAVNSSLVPITSPKVQKNSSITFPDLQSSSIRSPSGSNNGTNDSDEVGVDETDLVLIIEPKRKEYKKLRNVHINDNKLLTSRATHNTVASFMLPNLATNPDSNTMEEHPGIIKMSVDYVPNKIRIGYLKIEGRTVRPTTICKYDVTLYWIIKGTITVKSAGGHYEEGGQKYLYGRDFSAGTCVVVPRNTIYIFENWRSQDALLSYSMYNSETDPNE